MNTLAYVNGVFCPISEATVSIEDRGFQFGDGVYEVVLAYDGQPFLLDRHMRRLRRSAEGIRLSYDFDNNPLEPIIEEGLSRAGLADALVYIQLTRGVASRHHLYDNNMTPTVVMTFKPQTPLPDNIHDQGISLMTVPEQRWARCFIKAVTLLPNVLAKSEAVSKGFQDAVFIADGGEVRESTSANVFMVKDGVLVFPKRDESVLHGITQQFLLECAEALSLPTDERVVLIDEMCASDEVFISSTTVEVLAVTAIDSKQIADGKPGPVTRALHDEFRERARRVAIAGRQ